MNTSFWTVVEEAGCMNWVIREEDDTALKASRNSPQSAAIRICIRELLNLKSLIEEIYLS